MRPTSFSDKTLRFNSDTNYEKLSRDKILLKTKKSFYLINDISSEVVTEIYRSKKISYSNLVKKMAKKHNIHNHFRVKIRLLIQKLASINAIEIL